MADEADVANNYSEMMLQALLSNLKHSDIDYFNIGECDFCSEVGRLIEGICVPCKKLQEMKEKNWKIR